jgi:hypothetical protein
MVKVLQNSSWGFNGGGTFRDNISLFWHFEKLEKDPFFSRILFNKIQNKLNIKADLKRCYANGQTASLEGNPHTDTADGDFTFLFFPLPWQFNWGGNLVFIENDEVFKAVTCKENRALLFDNRILHYAEAPIRCFKGLRISIAWKIENVIFN